MVTSETLSPQSAGIRQHPDPRPGSPSPDHHPPPPATDASAKEEDSAASAVTTRHKQVRVQVGDFEADVDEELAPLIRELWKADIATVLSCQENRPGIAWIMFAQPDDLARFLDIVARYDPKAGSLYRRISLPGDDEGCWEYAVWPEDMALNETVTEDDVEESHEGQPCFIFNVSVRFPRTDLPILLDRMVQHNASLRIVAGYCDLCRRKEVELYGTVLSTTDHRHEKACVEAGCKHPPSYRFPATVAAGPKDRGQHKECVMTEIDCFDFPGERPRLQRP